MKAVGAALLALVTTDAIGPHLAVVLILLIETSVAGLLLPKCPRGLPEELLASYRAERRAFWQVRRRRVLLWASCALGAMIFGNGFGLPGVDYVVNLAVASALLWQTIATAQRADKMFDTLAERMRDLLAGGKR